MHPYYLQVPTKQANKLTDRLTKIITENHYYCLITAMRTTVIIIFCFVNALTLGNNSQLRVPRSAKGVYDAHLKPAFNSYSPTKDFSSRRTVRLVMSFRIRHASLPKTQNSAFIRPFKQGHYGCSRSNLELTANSIFYFIACL